MSWSLQKKKECTFGNNYFVTRSFFQHLYFIFIYSVLNKLSEYIYIYIYIYQVSGCQLSFFKVTRRTEEDINQRPKILREEDNTGPAIPVDVASTATLTEDTLEVNNDLLLTENQKQRNKTYIAINSIV